MFSKEKIVFPLCNIWHLIKPRHPMALFVNIFQYAWRIYLFIILHRVCEEEGKIFRKRQRLAKK